MTPARPPLMRVGRSPRQHEALVTIAAIDIAFFVNLKPDAWMAERSPSRNVERTVASDPAGFDEFGFRRVSHESALSNPAEAAQLAVYSPIRTRT